MSLNHFLRYKSNTTIPYFRRLIITTEDKPKHQEEKVSKRAFLGIYIRKMQKHLDFVVNLVQNIVDFELLWVIGGKTLQFFLKKSIDSHNI